VRPHPQLSRLAYFGPPEKQLPRERGGAFTMNCILYARVSTDKQAEKDLSIPAQLQLMRDYARQHDWTVVDEFIEPGASATTAQRRELQRLLTRVTNGDPKIDVVVVHKLDRMARNIEDHVAIRASLKRSGARLASVVENVDESVSGQLIENIMASIAQFYSGNLADEVRKGMRQKVLQGGWPHRPPRGYIAVRPTDGGGKGSRCELHPRESGLIARAFSLFAGGQLSIDTVASKLAAEGLTSSTGTPLSHSYMKRILTNPFYVGRIEWKDLRVKGQHQPLVEESLFERVQETFRSRYIRPLSHRTTAGFPLKGLATCARCRGHMTAERHGRWGYYRCSRKANNPVKCDARFCPVRRAHADVLRLLRGLQLTRDAADEVAREATRLIQLRAETASERRRVLEGEQAQVVSAEGKLTEIFLAGHLSPEVYQQKAFALRSRQSQLERDVQATAAPTGQLQERVRKSLDLSTSMGDLYEQFDDWRRRELLKAVFTGVVLGADGLVGYSLRAPFASLRESHSAGARAEAILDAA
jgi:site-specific DNA recombinase